MITSFEVGSIFKIVDQGSPAIKKLAKTVGDFDASISVARKNVTALARTRLVGISNQFKALSKEVGLFDRSIMGVAATMGRMSRASAVFADVTTEIAGASVAVGALAKEWDGLALAAGAANREMRAASRVRGPATTALTTGTDAAIASATILADTWRVISGEIGTSAAGARLLARGTLPAIAGGGGGAGGPRRSRGVHGPRGGGLHVSGLSADLPGGHAHFRGGGNAAMAAAGALAYGVYEESEVEDVAARAMITGQIKVDDGMRYSDAYKQLRDVIQRNSISGGFSPKDVGEAVLGSERQFSGLAFPKRMQVLNTALPFAMQEARLKETNLKESMEALVGLAHMTGTYDPVKLPELYRKFAYASQLTPKSLPQYVNALSYAMPSLVGGMGMDPDAIMFLTAMNQQAGIGSSKAGTWIQAFFSKLMPATGANLTKSKEKHNEALTNIGLLGANGKPTWMVTGQSGKTDWMASLIKLSQILPKGLAAQSDVTRMQTMDDVFGKQGGREAGLFNIPEFIGQFPQLARQLDMAKGGDDVLNQYGEGSPVQQSRQAFAELTAVLMDLGQVVLPPLTESLKGVSAALKAVHDAWPEQGHIGGMPEANSLGDRLGKGMGVGAVIGGVIGGVAGAFGGPFAPASIPAGIAWGAAYGATAGGSLYGAGHLFGLDGAPKSDSMYPQTGGIAPIGGLEFGSMGVGAPDTKTAENPWSVTPPPQKIEITPGKVTLNLDGRTIGEATVSYVVAQGNGPAEGSPYPDTTRGGSTFDFALVN
jgi:hypothetical protein